MRKSHKKLAPVYAYPHAYTQIRDRGAGQEKKQACKKNEKATEKKGLATEQATNCKIEDERLAEASPEKVNGRKEDKRNKRQLKRI